MTSTQRFVCILVNFPFSKCFSLPEGSESLHRAFYFLDLNIFLTRLRLFSCVDFVFSNTSSALSEFVKTRKDWRWKILRWMLGVRTSSQTSRWASRSPGLPQRRRIVVKVPQIDQRKSFQIWNLFTSMMHMCLIVTPETPIRQGVYITILSPPLSTQLVLSENIIMKKGGGCISFLGKYIPLKQLRRILFWVFSHKISVPDWYSEMWNWSGTDPGSKKKTKKLKYYIIF